MNIKMQKLYSFKDINGRGLGLSVEIYIIDSKIKIISEGYRKFSEQELKFNTKR